MPDACAVGVRDELARHAHASHASHWASIDDGLRALGEGFASLSNDEQDRRLQVVAGEAWFTWLVRLASEAYYGRRGAPSWQGLGYVEAPQREPGAPIAFPT